MSHALVRLAGVSRESVSIYEAQYAAIVEAKAKLLECLFVEEKFDLVFENYLELEMTLLECALGFLAAPSLDRPRMDANRALFNRRLVNLLSAARTYAEQVSSRHAPTILPADDCDVIVAAFSEQYDLRLGYRAMDALRNHVQHFDAPVGLVSYPLSRVERKSDYGLAFTVNPCLRPDDLRRNPKFKRRVLKELEALGDSVDLKPLVREYVEGLWAVHAQLRNRMAPYVERWEAILEQAKATYLAGCEGEKSTFSLAAVVLGADGRYERTVEIFTEFNEYRTFLESKNGGLDGLALRYVTGEAADGKP